MSRADILAKFTDVLAEHDDWDFNHGSYGSKACCQCGHPLLLPEDYGDIETTHRTHVAAVLADALTDELAAAKAEALREAADDKTDPFPWPIETDLSPMVMTNWLRSRADQYDRTEA